MSVAGRFERLYRNLLPSPFALAVLLTFVVFLAGLIFFKPEGMPYTVHTMHVVNYWYEGLWSGPMLVFGYQMMLILVLGHVLALAPPVGRAIDRLTKYCDTTPKAAAIVTFFCVVLGLINWGLALIFGAIFARKVAEYATRKGFRINYPLIAASGYTGLMVWHGGFSGSSLIKVAETGHLAALMSGNPSVDIAALPSFVGFDQTVFSPMNLSVSLALIVILPFSAYAIGKQPVTKSYFIKKARPVEDSETGPQGRAEELDYRPAPALLLGFLALLTVAVIAAVSTTSGRGNFVNPNFLNLGFLGLGLIAHGNLSRFAAAVEEAIRGAAGILIQFPLYFGILGIMNGAGIVTEISSFFVAISNSHTYPIFSFISAGFVNLLVPSGGGQWMVQGPIVVEASQAMGLDLGKSILSLAYGDQITNMIQPFWALPLLAITGLKARQILPYTFYFMLIGTVIFTAALLIF